DLSSKNLDGVIKFLEGKSVKSGSDKNNQEERISGDYYELIQRELLRKLKEYNYETNALFPDFSDYLIYKSKEFELKDDKKSNRAVLNELKKNSNNLPYHKSKKNRKGKYRITRVWRKSL
ncbi:FRG domain-containing protein, partial [Streptococcus pseudopneumoniae]